MARTPRVERNIFVNDTIWYSVSMLDSANTSGIYSGYVTAALLQAFQQSLQFIFFPIYAINAFFYVILSLTNMLMDRHEKSNKLKKENVIRLVISGLSATLVAIAVIGSLLVIGLATTLLFAANFALTGIYNFIGAGYHLYHYLKKGRRLTNDYLEQDERERLVKERQMHFGSMLGYFITGVTVAMCALAASLAILGGFLPLAGIGIAAGVLGFGFSAFALYKTIRRHIATNKQNAAYEAEKKDVAPNDTFPINVLHRQTERSHTNSTSRMIAGFCENLSSTVRNITRRFTTTEPRRPVPPAGAIAEDNVEKETLLTPSAGSEHSEELTKRTPSKGLWSTL